MNFRMGLALAASLSLVAGACAGSPGGDPSASAPGPRPAGETLATGESPRNDEHTRASERALESAQAAEMTGDSATAAEHYQASLAAAQAGIGADPTNPLAWRFAALAAIGLEDYAAADSLMARAETLRPLYTIETERIREQAWVDLYTAASPFVNEGAYEEAIPYFEDANSIYRGRPEVMLMLGQIYANLGRYDEAVANLRTALEMVNGPRFDEMDPSIQAVWTEQRETLPLLIAQTLMNAQRYPEAAAELRALLVDSPGDLILTRNLASLYVEMEMTDSATVLFDQLLARTDLGAGDYYQIGIGLYSMDDFDRAADAFQATVEEAPRDRDAVEMWTRSIHEGHPPRDSVEAPMEVLDELESAADQWLELDPYNRNALLILAQTTNRKGDSESAAAWVSRIEALPVTVDNLQARRDPDGGATVTGSVMNVNQEAGASVIFRFTFYGEGGAAIGTQDATVRLSAPDQSQVFQVVFESSERVLGYTYEILM